MDICSYHIKRQYVHSVYEQCAWTSTLTNAGGPEEEGPEAPVWDAVGASAITPLS